MCHCGRGKEMEDLKITARWSVRDPREMVKTEDEVEMKEGERRIKSIRDLEKQLDVFRKNVNLGGPGNDPAKSIKLGKREEMRLMLGEE